jgi:hypothetical protein
MAKQSLKDMFSTYTTENDKVLAARKALEEAMLDRGKTVEAIKNEYGAGPFDLNGDVFSIRKRGIKNEDDVIIGSTFFMVKAGGKLQKV